MSKKKLRACIDIGGTKMLAALIDRDGAVVARLKQPTQTRSQPHLLAQLDGAIHSILREAGAKESSLEGIALGVPGVVRGGVVVLAPNVPLGGLDLRGVLSKRYSVAVRVANDGSLGTLGEVALGAARGANLCYGFFVGTGIGGGLVLGGHMVEGARGLGGEVGHLLAPVWNDLETQDIGTLNTQRWRGLSDLCSREAIEKYLRRAIVEEGRSSALPEITGDATLARIRAGALKKALKQEDAVVSEALRRCSFLLGMAAASVSNVIDPDVIVFGGGVIEACGKWMLPWIRESAHSAALSGDWPRPHIVQSALGDDAILLGGWRLLASRHARVD